LRMCADFQRYIIKPSRIKTEPGEYKLQIYSFEIFKARVYFVNLMGPFIDNSLNAAVLYGTVHIRFNQSVTSKSSSHESVINFISHKLIREG
jgi:hypothetical protein